MSLGADTLISFTRNCQTLILNCNNLLSHQQCIKASVIPPAYQHFLLSPFKNLAFEYTMESNSVSVFICLMTNGLKHLFTYLLVRCTFLYCKVSIQTFALFCYFFFLLICSSFKNIHCGCECFVRCIYCKYLLQVCSYYFHFLNWVL